MGIKHFYIKMFWIGVFWFYEQAVPHLHIGPTFATSTVAAGLAFPSTTCVFIVDVVDELDLAKILEVYGGEDGRGLAAYHPLMMVRLLLYGYCRGVVSSHKIERGNL